MPNRKALSPSDLTSRLQFGSWRIGRGGLLCTRFEVACVLTDSVPESSLSADPCQLCDLASSLRTSVSSAT